MTYPNHNERLGHKQSTLLLTRYREQGIPGSQAFHRAAAGIILIAGRNMQRPILFINLFIYLCRWFFVCLFLFGFFVCYAYIEA